jgi:signal transduction histidine kinase
MAPCGHEDRAGRAYAEVMSSGGRRAAQHVATDLATARMRLAGLVNEVVTEGVTDPPAPRPRWLQRGPVDLVLVADLLIGVICLGTTVSWLDTRNAQTGGHFSSGMLALFALAISVPMLIRNRFPAQAWLISAAALAWTSIVLGPGTLSSAAFLPGGVLVYMLCLYAIAVRCRGWFVIAAAGVTVLGGVLIEPRTGASVLLAAIPLLAGAIVRSRRSTRVVLAQQARQHQGERALLEERQRIARELHDVVAHHMSVIAIQAEAAPRKVADPPPELAESFADIRASALSGLTELRRLLGVLRSSEADRAPLPGLAELAGLLDSARSGGVGVTLAVSGTPRDLPPGVDLSAYRIVQEALSNAMRHAPGAAVRVELAYFPSSLVIKVRNDEVPGGLAAGRPGLGGAGGHGLIGMRERAAMLGGQLDAGPSDDGGFLVTATLPDPDRRLEAQP